MFKQTNTGTVLRSVLGRLLRDRGRAHMDLPKYYNAILSKWKLELEPTDLGWKSQSETHSVCPVPVKMISPDGTDQIFQV